MRAPNIGEYTPGLRRNIVAVSLLLVATTLAMLTLFNLAASNTPEAGSVVTISGTPICLPHKDTHNPVTLECAAGLKGDDGRNYALTNAPVDLLEQDFGKRVLVKGVLVTPLPSEIYTIAGTIDVQTAIRQ